MTTGKRILGLRHKLGLTQAELGQRLGVHYVSVCRWENDSRLPGRDMLVKIAELGDVTVDWLLGRASAEPEDELRQLLNQQHQEFSEQQRTIERFIADTRRRGTGQLASDIEGFARIPLVGEVCAGDGIFAEENIEEYLLVPRHDIPAGVSPFYVEVNGDCLREGWGIHDGDLVCVGPGLEPRNGDLVVAIINNDAHLKRLKKAGDQIVLASDDDELELTPADEAHIIGPVLWCRRYYRR